MRRAIKISAFLAPFLLGCVLAASFPRWTVDDAYITFRYAENLAARGRLTWNEPGGERTEGYTGVALPVLLAVLARAGVPAEACSRAIGFLSFFSAGALLLLILRRLKLSTPAISAALFLYFGAPFLYTHAGSGLETALFLLSVLACVLSALALDEKTKNSWAHGAVFSLSLLASGLIRPEGAALAAFFAAAALMAHGKGGKALKRSLLLFFILPGAAYFLWRADYYGRLLPNSFLVKAHLSAFAPSSAAGLRSFLILYLVLPLGAGVFSLLPAIWSAGNTGRNSPRRRVEVFLPLAAFVCVCVLVYARSDLLMNYSFRFFAPLYAPALIAAAFLFDKSLREILEGKGRFVARSAGAAVLAIGLFGQAFFYFEEWPKEKKFAADYQALLEDAHFQAAKLIRARVPENGRLAVLGDAGAIPYLTKLQAADFGGLNSAKIARFIKDEPSKISEYFFANDFCAVVVNSFEWERTEGDRVTNMVIKDPRFGIYELAGKFRSRTKWPYFVFVFLKAGGCGAAETGAV